MESLPWLLIGLFGFGLAQLAIGVVIGRVLAERLWNRRRRPKSGSFQNHSGKTDSRSHPSPTQEEVTARLYRLMADVRDELGLHREHIEQLARKLAEASEVQPQELAKIFLEAVSRSLQINQWLRERLEIAEERLRQQAEDLRRYSREARTDPLTGVLNRRAFQTALSEAICSLPRQGKSLALMLVDLDHFKVYNDRLGHPVGDLLLKTLAERLKRLAGDALVARVGGEEFAILLPGLEPAAVEDLARRIHREVKTPVRTPYGPVVCSISGGIAFATSSDTADSLYDRADKTLYAAKRAGRDRILAIDGTEIRTVAPPDQKTDSAAGLKVPERAVAAPLSGETQIREGFVPQPVAGVSVSAVLGTREEETERPLSSPVPEQIIRELREKLHALLESGPIAEEFAPQELEKL